MFKPRSISLLTSYVCTIRLRRTLAQSNSLAVSWYSLLWEIVESIYCKIAGFFLCELSLRAGVIYVCNRHSVNVKCDSKSSLVQMHSISLRHLVPRHEHNNRASKSCIYDTMCRRWFLRNRHKLDIKKRLWKADFQDKITVILIFLLSRRRKSVNRKMTKRHSVEFIGYQRWSMIKRNCTVLITND